MLTPMDRGFGDDVFRKLEKRKLAKKLGMPMQKEDDWDLEVTI